MKLFLMYAYNLDGIRDFLWAKRRLPADFDFQAWASSTAEIFLHLPVSGCS